MRLERILETCLYAADLGAMERFYREVLGLELFAKQPGRHLFFRMKEQMLLVFNPAVTLSGQEETPPHGVKGDGHLAFAVTEPELTGWRKRLGEFKVEIEKEMTWPSGGKSIYFRDPAGNSLEFATSKIWGIQEKV